MFVPASRRIMRRIVADAAPCRHRRRRLLRVKPKVRYMRACMRYEFAFDELFWICVCANACVVW